MAGIDLNTEVRALAAVAAGGALGAPARYGVAQLIHTAPLASGGFAWATFWTNVSGSFALGLILMLAFRWLPMSLHLRRFLTTGFLGAFATFLEQGSVAKVMRSFKSRQLAVPRRDRFGEVATFLRNVEGR